MTTPTDATQSKPKFIQSILEVKRKEWLTPRLLRVVLTGEDVPLFAETTVGENNKIFLPREGQREIVFPRMERGRRVMPDGVEPPVIRTFTHRGIDLEANEIWIDFVVHGDEGPASAWASRAQSGDVLGVAMKLGPSELIPAADEYILAGDMAAVPVLSSILESLPASARAKVVLEVHGPEDELPISTDAQADIRWLHNPEPTRGSRLPEAVRALELPPQGTKRFAYVAAELRAVRSLREFFRLENGWGRDELYAYSYWKADAPEDVSEPERRQERDSL